MKVTTGWLTPPTAIGGIDHLGTQAPCQLIYSQLIPGITNVSDRARYYALYPWLVRTFDQRYPDADAAEFVKLFRRGDFLLTLIADRHARELAEPDGWHGAAMAGRTQMTAATDQLKATGTIDLEMFTTTNDIPTRYFKNRLGGLGQYYVGILAELGLLDTTTHQWVKYTHELGAPLADAVEATVPAHRFWAVVASGRVNVDDLDALHAFCPCGLQEDSKEHTVLLQMFFGESEPFIHSGRQRRASLEMWLHLAHALSGQPNSEFDEASFRGAIYANSLPSGISWPLPASLQTTRALWGIYETNDLLSVGFQGIFASALEHLARHQSSEEARFPTVETLAADLSQGPLGDALIAACGTERFSDFIDSLRSSAPARGDWLNPRHEHELCIQLMRHWRSSSSDGERLALAFELIALLLARDDVETPTYGGLAISPDELRNYPINLQSLRERAIQWGDYSVRSVLDDAVRWSLSTHLTVALRKLRQTGRSTFRFRPGELGLEITDSTPLPARTTPRFNQTTQILIDLRTLRQRSASNADDIELTPLGFRMMAGHDH